MLDLFSKRQRKLRGDVPDVYVYADVPKALRVQVVHIWNDALGGPENYHNGRVSEAYKVIVNALCREYGLFELPGTRYDDSHREALVRFLIEEPDVERVLDATELSFRLIDRVARDWGYLQRHNSEEVADAAIAELNSRFREHGIGYQYSDGEIIRVDSELLHAEVVRPALRLLNQKHFAGAQQEFLKAHEHYRAGNDKEALNECLKSFESVMKSICEKRGWSYTKTASAKELLQVCFDHGLVPAYWQSATGALRSLLEGGVPTGRNKLSGHGQGTRPTSVSDHVVAYMMHMTAAAIVFVAEADAALD